MSQYLNTLGISWFVR